MGPVAMDGGPLARAVVLTAVAAAGLTAYLGMRPQQPWLLVFTAVLVGLAASGTVRNHPRWTSRGEVAAGAFMFLPAIAAIAVGAFVDRAFDGYARPLLALAGACAVGLTVLGEYYSVDFESRLYGPVKLALAVATYLAAFALYAVIYSQKLPLPLSVVAVGGVSCVLAIDLLRESRAVGLSSLLAGLAVGLSMAELRLTLYFFPLDGLLAGALLIIGFYLATGIVHHLLDHDLSFATLAEYVLVAGIGTGVVVLARTLA